LASAPWTAAGTSGSAGAQSSRTAPSTCTEWPSTPRGGRSTVRWSGQSNRATEFCC